MGEEGTGPRGDGEDQQVKGNRNVAGHEWSFDSSAAASRKTKLGALLRIAIRVISGGHHRGISDDVLEKGSPISLRLRCIRLSSTFL